MAETGTGDGLSRLHAIEPTSGNLLNMNHVHTLLCGLIRLHRTQARNGPLQTFQSLLACVFVRPRHTSHLPQTLGFSRPLGQDRHVVLGTFYLDLYGRDGAPWHLLATRYGHAFDGRL